MKKRIVSLLLAFVMMIPLLPSSIAVESDEEDWGTPYAVTGGNIYYSISEDGDEAGITHCDPEVTEATIPSSINGVPVVIIAMDAFGECTKLTSVSIPDSVTTIFTGAFLGCTGLTSIEIPDSVEFIGSWAFCDCSGLISITLPDNAGFGEATFAGCTSVEYFSVSENHKYYSTVDGVLFNKDGTVLEQYPAGNPRKTYTIPDGVTVIDAIGMMGGAFSDCNNLTNVIVPDSVIEINFNAFYNAKGLTSISLPVSIASIGSRAFSGCNSLRDIYYAGSESQWKQIEIGEVNDSIASATIHYNSTAPSSTPSATGEEHIYDTLDPGEDTKLDADRLNRVTDPSTAASAVRNMVDGMTQAQKASPMGIDLATLYAETAVAKAASKSFTGNDVLINAAAMADLEAEAAQVLTAVETALASGGITTARELSSTVTFTTTSTSEISIRIDPDILTTGVDKIRVEGPSYTLTFTVSELEEDLTNTLTFKAEPINALGTALAGRNTAVPLAVTLLVNRTADTEPVYLANTGTNAVKVTLPGGNTSNPVTVSLPKDNSKDTTYQALVNSTGTATSSKYNPATTNVDGKVNTSGTYTVTTKEVNFTDITNKSAEMQKAIKYLASKGIISGTGGTNYSPDASISRAEIAALLVRALGKLNSSATNSFTDVKSSDWYYTAAGSSQRAGYISGYEDNTFRGTTTINKEQIVAVAARVLINDMKYKTPGNTATYLGKYSDTVASWAQPQVALATKENLVVYRTDGTFSGAKNMTRGDAAIIIYRLFQKIW